MSLNTRSPYVIASGITLVLLSAVGFLPLFGGPGYEQSLATGLLVPTAAAIAQARDCVRGGTKTPLETLMRGVLAGLGFAGISLFTAIVHGLRVGICEWWGALLYFALTAGCGCVLGGAWGALVGELVAAYARRGSLKRLRSWCALGALAAPIACVVVSLVRFHGSPMIFAFDPFVGFFSGTLYDTVIEPGLALYTYRLGSLSTLICGAFVASLVTRTDRGFRIDPRQPRAVLALVAGLASLGISLFGTKLGHWSTVKSIQDELGAELVGQRCIVEYPSTTRLEEAKLLVKDCDEEVRAVETRLGAQGPAKVRAFFFRDAEQKKRLMGAANTYIAKPWREEVYLQLGGYPHPVLAHELAHVISGSFGHGPFRIAGSLGGYLPNPGLVEGLAVYASPEDEDLTDLQWAKAMKQIGILPQMERVFSLGFLGDASSKSYTLAGAFIDTIATRYGIAIVRRWYGGEDISALTNKSWPELEKEFHETIDKVELPPDAESFARAKFARPGIFGRKCPHVVDALRHEADICRDSQRYADAIRLYREALAKDAVDFASRKELANVERRHGDREVGRLALDAMAKGGDKVPRTWRDRAEEALADAEMIDGAWADAAPRYEALAKASLDEDSARTLEIKAIAARDPEARPAIMALLLGDTKHGADIFLGGRELGAWITEKKSPLAGYLIGRNLTTRGFYEQGSRALDEALAAPLPTRRVTRETIRQRAIAACATSDKRTLLELKSRIEAPDSVFDASSGGRREATLRMIVRCLASD